MFILDYDFMTKEDWLKWVNEEFKKPEPFLSNPVLTLEDEHLCIFNQTFELESSRQERAHWASRTQDIVSQIIISTLPSKIEAISAY